MFDAGSSTPAQSAAQPKSLDLCDLLGQPTPAQQDAVGERFAFEKHVGKVYGWPADLSKQDVLARLLALNHERAAAQPQ